MKKSKLAADVKILREKNKQLKKELREIKTCLSNLRSSVQTNTFEILLLQKR